MQLSAHAEKRIQIMADCARIFRHRGYHGTAMSDIAEAVQLNKGTVYYYYPSKSDILYAIYLEAYERLDENIAKVPSDLPADEELAAYVKAITLTTASNPDVTAVYFQEHPWLETSLTAEQYSAIRTKEAEFTNRIRAVIKKGMRTREFRRVNDELLTIQLLAMVSSLYRWHVAESASSAQLVADTIVSYLYDGIKSAS